MPFLSRAACLAHHLSWGGIFLGSILASAEPAKPPGRPVLTTPTDAGRGASQPLAIGASDIRSAQDSPWAAVPDGAMFAIGGYAKMNDGGGGIFYVDKGDQTSAEDEGTVFIARDGTRLKRLITGPLTVRWFGAMGDGRSDDTAAITAAWNYCVAPNHYAPLLQKPTPAESTGPTLYFPAGDYVFSGPSLTFHGNLKTFRLSGDGLNAARIRIQNGDYLIKIGDVNALSITGLQFFGGKGVLKVTNTAANVRTSYVIRDCAFYNYTECAVGHLATDMPAWRIENNIFMGSDEWTSIGVALNGLTDASVIRDNQFHRNRYGIKINGGYNAYIRNNAFLRFTTPNKDVADIWIVPVTSPHAQGMVIAENKFGNENLRPTDFRILVAGEEGPAGDFVTRSHSSDDLGNTRQIGLLQLRANNFASTSGYSRGIVSSYTSEVRSIHSDDMFSGSYPRQLIQFLGNFSPARTNTQNLLDASQFYNSTEGLVPPFSANAIGLTRDPWGNMGGADSAVQYFTTGEDPAYEILLDPLSLNSSLSATATKLPQNDVYGGANAVQLTWKNTGNYAQAYFTVRIARKPVWVEFDLRQAPERAFQKLVVDIRPATGSELLFRRTVRVPTEWQRVRLLWFPETAGDYRLLLPDGLEPYFAGQSESVLLARLHVYQAHEPVANGLLRGTGLILQSAPPPPADAPGKSVLFIDPVDNILKIRLPNGTMRSIVTKP